MKTTKPPRAKSPATKEAYFNRFTLALPALAVGDCSHQGACDDDVAAWAPRIERPANITPEALANELHEYGAWDADELSDDAANWRRLIWLAAGQIQDEEREAAR